MPLGSRQRFRRYFRSIDYPELAAGASGEGVITFKNVDQADFTYQCGGSDADYNDLNVRVNVAVH